MSYCWSLMATLCVGTILSVAACGASPEAVPGATALTSPSPAVTMVPASPSPVASLAPTLVQAETPESMKGIPVERLMALAKQDLAGRTGVPASEVTLVGTTGETWRDTSLGCPEPGKSYAQVLTPGYRIVLESKGKQYEYHTDMTRVVLCADPA